MIKHQKRNKKVTTFKNLKRPKKWKSRNFNWYNRKLTTSNIFVVTSSNMFVVILDVKKKNINRHKTYGKYSCKNKE